MLNTLILLVFVESAVAGGTGIRCDFPGEDQGETPIRVHLEPRPSLKDQPGLFRVMMEMNGRVLLKATAQPILATADRDVMFRGVQSGNTRYILGLRDDGWAAFHVQTGAGADGGADAETRTGACRGYEPHINRWLPR